MQIVGYETGVSGLDYDPVGGTSGAVEPPALLIAEGGTVRREPLEPGARIEYTIGRRHCAGVLDGDAHRACGDGGAPYCPDHADDWPYARCAGECDLPLPSCNEEHAVYLAAFAPATFKVGVTRLSRLLTRLREQGADRAAHLHTVSDGRLARRIEREIADRVADRVPTEAKVEGLGRPLDADAWARFLGEFDIVETFAFDYGLALDSRPVRETLATGTVRGTKGRLVVLDHGGETYAVDARDLVGHDVEAGPTGRDLQSSLGSFG